MEGEKGAVFVSMLRQLWSIWSPIVRCYLDVFYFTFFLFPGFIILKSLIYLVRTNSGLGGFFLLQT